MLLGRTARRQILVLLPVYANGITSGCVIGWTANAVYLFFRPDAEIKVNAEQIWWIISMMEIGKMIFSIPAGMLADCVGKENILTNVGIIHFTSWLMLSVCTSVPLICLARFLAGIGTALLNAAAMATIGEIASPGIRGMLAGLQQTFVVLGNLSQAVVTALFPSYYLLSYITTIISAIYFVTIFWQIETPCSLIKARKYNQAKNNLRYLRPENTDKEVEEEYQQLKGYVEEDSMLNSDMSCFQIINSKNTFKQIVIAALINFFMLFSGVSVILTYITEIIPPNNLISKKYYPLIIMSVSVFSSFATNLIIDWFPRRMVFMLAAILAGMIQVVNGLTYCLFVNYGLPWCGWIFSIGNFLYRVHWALLLLPVNSAVRSEIFPQSVKGVGNAFCDMAQAMAITLTFKLYGCMSEPQDLSNLYFIFACSAVVLFFLILLFLPEGRGKSLVEIQKEEIMGIGNNDCIYMRGIP